MVLFNYSTRELTAKIVFYGPGLCGKTTNLQYIHSTLPDNVRGKMLSLATKTDRTLFFDFLPIDLGQIRGMKTRVQLYTVPGQVFYNETRKLVLKGADGIVFVADSQATMLGANVESFKNLEENLKAHGMKLAEMPHVLQFNKRDLPRLASIEELNAAINRFNAPFYESVATSGIGVQDTLKAITKLVLLHLTKKYDPKTAAAVAKPEPPAPMAATTRAAAPPPAETPTARATPQRPIASPAQTMQMPAASLSPERTDAPRAIPLSTSAESEPSGRSPVPTFGHEISIEDPAASDPVSDPFADEEIQELVDEVQDSQLEVQDSFGTIEIGRTAVEEAEEEEGVGLSFEPLDPDPGTQVAWSEPVEAPPVRAPRAPVPPSDADQDGAFEIDHGIDPDWSTDSLSADVDAPDVDRPAGGADDRDGVWDLGEPDDLGPQTVEPDAPEPAPHAHQHRADVDVPREEKLPRLTEVVADHELFDDPGLDVARLVAGEEREVIVPVEFEDGDCNVRRFKLSIRLRMESLD